ncbi:MBL fold metallo-hydrolase [Candidatus Woesearchaeota archaeon]|nr:MBL fold metallo-hydrolase [Candidatus Woesearchaeota archaeon]
MNRNTNKNQSRNKNRRRGHRPFKKQIQELREKAVENSNAKLEIIPLGGFSEIGRNSVAIRADDEVIILDLGLMMDKYIEYTDSDDLVEISGRKLIEIGAAPDVNILGKLKKQVKAILLTHAHLDHIGSVPYIANKFDCDIHSAPFTIELVRRMYEDEKRMPRGKLVAHDVNSRFKIGTKFEVEFIFITHSAPQTVMALIHTPYGKILYANDFKFDNNPTMGQKPNYERLRELKGQIDYLIVDTLYADQPIKTPSEKIAEEMLKDVLLGTQSRDATIIVSTFSSHIARIRAIINVAKMMKRTPVLLGRSLFKYTDAAEAVGLADFSDAERVPYGSKVRSYLKKLKNPEKYLLIATGHQGEPKAILSRIVDQNLLKLTDNDMVIFSSKTIPVPVSIANREKLDAKLRAKHVRIFDNIHVSGHGAREDHRDFLNMLKPKHIIPTHGNMKQLNAFRELAEEVGYKQNQIRIIKVGERVKVA